MGTPNLYIYWAHDTGMMSPTLQMARTYLKRRIPITKLRFLHGFRFQEFCRWRFEPLQAWPRRQLARGTSPLGQITLPWFWRVCIGAKGDHIPHGQTVSRTRIFYAFRLWLQMGCSSVIPRRDEIAPSSEPYHYWNQLYKPTKDQQKLPRVTAFMGARHWKNENQ